MYLNVLFFWLSINISHSLMSLFRLIINCKRGSVSSNAGPCLCSGCSVCSRSSSSLSVSWWEERRDFPTSAPTMYFYIPAYVWLAQPEFRIPKSSQIGITFFLFLFLNYKKGKKKSCWCNDLHFLKSTLDPRLTRRKDICCTWDPSQVGNGENLTRLVDFGGGMLMGPPRIGRSPGREGKAAGLVGSYRRRWAFRRLPENSLIALIVFFFFAGCNAAPLQRNRRSPFFVCRAARRQFRTKCSVFGHADGCACAFRSFTCVQIRKCTPRA